VRSNKTAEKTLHFDSYEKGEMKAAGEQQSPERVQMIRVQKELADKNRLLMEQERQHSVLWLQLAGKESLLVKHTKQIQDLEANYTKQIDKLNKDLQSSHANAEQERVHSNKTENLLAVHVKDVNTLKEELRRKSWESRAAVEQERSRSSEQAMQINALKQQLTDLHKEAAMAREKLSKEAETARAEAKFALTQKIEAEAKAREQAMRQAEEEAKAEAAAAQAKAGEQAMRQAEEKVKAEKAAAAAASVDAAAQNAQRTCTDVKPTLKGGWPCKAPSCPLPRVRCAHLAYRCQSTFGDALSALVLEIPAETLVLTYCPKTCGTCTLPPPLLLPPPPLPPMSPPPPLPGPNRKARKTATQMHRQTETQRPSQAQHKHTERETNTQTRRYTQTHRHKQT